MKIKFLKTTFTSLILFVSTFANAGLITQSNSYTYFEVGNGLEWVYAAPCAIDSNPNGSCNTSPLTLIDGFRFASLQDWTDSFRNLTELVTAFSSSTISEDDICSSEFFGTGRTFCNFRDLSNGAISGAPSFITTSLLAGGSAAESFLVRGQVSDVPEPSTLAIFALGIIGLASRRFKKQS